VSEGSLSERLLEDRLLSVGGVIERGGTAVFGRRILAAVGTAENGDQTHVLTAISPRVISKCSSEVKLAGILIRGDAIVI
jgi:hypothetical protein